MRHRIDRAERLIQLDAAVAGWTLHRMAGPGHVARHIFRGLPTTFLTGSPLQATRIKSVLREVDEWWLHIWALIGGTPWPRLSSEQKATVRWTVYGHDGLAH